MNLNNLLKGIVLVLGLGASMSANAQMEIQHGIEGKTFFDTARTEIHEAYEYKLRYRMIINPRTGEPEPVGEPQELKNGLYIKYRKDGTIHCTGYFRNDVKCGEWKFMDASGKVTMKTENHGGDCVISE